MKAKRSITLIIGLVLLLFGITVQTKAQDDKENERLVSGVIVDESGNTLPGVTIRIKEGNRGGLSDVDGSFSIRLAKGEHTLIFSYVGMKTQTVVVRHPKVLRIVMKDDTELLSEVVVTGYQTISKERATGSFAVVDPKTLDKKLNVNIIDRLEGQVAGLTNNRGSLSIRGIATLRGNSTPLIVLDGMPYEGSLSSINPSIITNITVLKDAAASSIYGARAANGVIVISTRQGEGNNHTRVSYDGSIHIIPIPNYDKLNLIDSRELVELQRYGIRFDQNDYNEIIKDERYAINPVYEALMKQKAGLITQEETDKILEHYSNLDNRQQLKDFFLRTGIQHQHNASISGGTDKNTYFASINYTGNMLNYKYAHDDMFGLTLRDNIKFFDWLSSDLGFSATTSRSRADTGADTFMSWYQRIPSYYMLRDERCNPIHIPESKSEKEIQKLIDLGLNDEHFSPIENLKKESSQSTENYYRINIGLNFKLLEGLTFDAKYLGEFTSYRSSQNYDKDSYFVRNMVNDAAEYDPERGELILNVPQGGQYSETRGDNKSYTIRGQFNYRLEKDQHYFTALAGSEIRRIKSTHTRGYYMGYDKNSLGYTPIDPIKLYQISGTLAPNSFFTWDYNKYNGLQEVEDRFVSFYANASYSYNQRYDVTGSIRIDQSNLFGTDPKYQYRPLWSIGGTWHIAQEAFMRSTSDWLDQFNIRLTYGIGGNVPKDAGPYLTLSAKEHNSLLGAFESKILNPPNPTLRWEKTATTNFGIDVSILRNLLWGSIDIYDKHTTDLLALRQGDPTLGWSDLLLNYGSMRNSGVDITLNARVASRDFEWRPTFTMGINHNTLLNVEESNPNTFDYTKGHTAAVGYPLNSIFSYRFAKLDEKGLPLYYTANNELTDIITDLDDIVYSGPVLPVYSGSLTNNFTYKNFDFSFMFIFNGGHVFRAETGPFQSMPGRTNVNREILNSWKKPGDEDLPDTTPAFTGNAVSREKKHMWHASDKQIMKGDYIKLRDLSFGYTMPNEIASSIGAQSVRVVLQVQDLFAINLNKKGFDAESMATYNYGWGHRGLPRQTSFTLGASINF